jgi:predicted metal-dependent hydrolase
VSVRVKDNPFSRGIQLFNQHKFFECHEVLEDLWRPERGERRLFLQGVIHLAVGFYHHQQENQAGASRQLQKGLKKLAGYLPAFEGVDTARLYGDSHACLERISSGERLAAFPQITPAAMPARSLRPARR